MCTLLTNITIHHEGTYSFTMKLTNGIIHHEFYYEILHGVILPSEEFMKKNWNDFTIVDVHFVNKYNHPPWRYLLIHNEVNKWNHPPRILLWNFAWSHISIRRVYEKKIEIISWLLMCPFFWNFGSMYPFFRNFGSMYQFFLEFQQFQYHNNPLHNFK